MTSSSKIVATINVATCILVTATALGLHQPRGGGAVGGSPAPYSNWYGTNAHQYYRDENYNPDMGQFQETSYSVIQNSEQQPVFGDFSDSSQPLQYHQHQHQPPHGPLPRMTFKVKSIFSRAKERVQDVVDHVFQSNLPDQEDYRNPPSKVAYYNSPVVYYGEDDVLVHEQVGSGGVVQVAEQWYPEEQSQHQHAHFYQITKPNDKYYKLDGGQGQYYNSEQQTLSMQQNGPSSSPPQQQTCGGGGLEGTEKCSPASGWGEDMDNDMPLPSSSSLAYCSTTVMDYTADPENPKQENDVLQSVVVDGSAVALRKKQGEGDKNHNVGKGDSLYDLYCLHCANGKQQRQMNNIAIRHSVDEERAAADGGWIVNGRTIDGEARSISTKTEQQQSSPESESSALAAHQRMVGLNVNNNHYETVDKETETVYETPPPHRQPGCDDVDEKKRSCHYSSGISSVIRRETELSNSFTSPTAIAMNGDKAMNLSANWPGGGYDIPRTGTDQGGKQHNYDDDDPASLGYAYTEPGGIGSAEILPHWECEGNGVGRGSSSMIGQGWDDADADAAQLSEVPETLTGTTEQPPVEGIRLGRRENNLLLCGDNDSSEGSWDFKETASSPRIDHRAHQQNRGMRRSVESGCILEEELPLHPLRSDVHSRISWNTRTNLVSPQELPPEGVRVLPNIEGGGDMTNIDETVEDDGYNLPKGGKKELLIKGDGDEENGDIETSSYIVARLLGEPSRDVLAAFEAELEGITKEVQKQIDEEENEEECCLVQVQPESREMGKHALRDYIDIPFSEAEATKLQGPIFKHQELHEDNPRSSTQQGKGMGSVEESGAVAASFIMPTGGTTHVSQIEGDATYSKSNLQNTIEPLPPAVIKGDMWNDQDLQEQLDKYWEHVKSKPNDDVTSTCIGNNEQQQQVARFGDWRPMVPNNALTSSSTNRGVTVRHSYVGGQNGQSPPINIYGDVYIHTGSGYNSQHEHETFRDSVNGENQVPPNHNSYWTGHH